MYCEAVGEWDRTPSLTEVTVDCQIGFTGSMRRVCNADGTWGIADTSECGMSWCCV